jgi:hypothetical protein
MGSRQNVLFRHGLMGICVCPARKEMSGRDRQIACDVFRDGSGN